MPLHSFIPYLCSSLKVCCATFSFSVFSLHSFTFQCSSSSPRLHLEYLCMKFPSKLHSSKQFTVIEPISAPQAWLTCFWFRVFYSSEISSFRVSFCSDSTLTGNDFIYFCRRHILPVTHNLWHKVPSHSSLYLLYNFCFLFFGISMQLLFWFEDVWWLVLFCCCCGCLLFNALSVSHTVVIIFFLFPRVSFADNCRD